MDKKFILFLGLVLLLKFTACMNTPVEEPAKATAEPLEVSGVSIWDRISTRSEPRRKSSSTTLLSLGERFVYLDSFAIDSSYNNTKFLKVRLSDSSVVWVYDFASVLNAIPVVITREVPLYLRPDLLTISDKSLHAMEIAAQTEEWDNWIKVVGEKKEKAGWIKKENISDKDIDLAFALIAKRKLEEQDPEQKISLLEEFLANNPYPQSIFIPEVRKILDNEKALLEESRRDNEWEERERRRRN